MNHSTILDKHYRLGLAELDKEAEVQALGVKLASDPNPMQVGEHGVLRIGGTPSAGTDRQHVV
jgi:hypothetical protein